MRFTFGIAGGVGYWETTCIACGAVVTESVRVAAAACERCGTIVEVPLLRERAHRPREPRSR